MKLIIAGGRDYHLTDDDRQKLDGIPNVSEVVSGGATGADAGGEQWASLRGIPVKMFRADWTRYGKYAGPRRNTEMAQYADAVALLPGGRGTADMAQQAVRRGLVIYDFRKA